MLSLTELPAALFGLKHLHGLNLGWRWRDASGKWQEAPGELRRNQVASSLGRLAALPDLRDLWLEGLDLDTLSSLSGLENLQSIDCSSTQVNDLAPLAGLQALESVDCSGTQVSDLAPLAGLQALQSIDCDETQVSDLAPLAQIASLRSITANGLKLAESSTACLALPALQELRCYQTRLRG